MGRKKPCSPSYNQFYGDGMKKIIVLMVTFLVVFLFLSGCETLNPVPTDAECQELISTYLLVHSDFYDVNNEITMSSWMGVGTQTRFFQWCHEYSGGEYCGAGFINSNRVITYEGD